MTYSDYLIIFFADYLAWFFVLGVIFFVFIFDSKKRLYILAEALAAAIFSRFVITEIIRFFYHTERPFETMPGVKQLIEHSTGGSFPSGHAAFFFAIAATIFIYNKRWGSLFLMTSIVMGIGRVAANLHWPVDILGGAVIAIVSSIVVHYFAKKTKDRYSLE